ncbi:MAG: NAD-dependent epimerase/dehydratase family protein, partial [bacterium]|jgi:UDP-glucose 4-epimerase|nr:NAD-dependent epimerase/dehydratase family protein [bacterium]
MRKNGLDKIVFTSTSTVYGEADEIPTPEEYGPLIPISLYASSKLASEGFITAYCSNFGMSSYLFRFANVVGPRSTHGVIYDLVNKLKKDSATLEILGSEPGTQKSYLYISDCIDGMIFACENSCEMANIFNIGSRDHISVKTLANSVCEAVGLSKVSYRWTGGVDGGRGWKGDVKIMLLGIDKLKKLGFVPAYGSSDAVLKTAKSLVE